MSVIPFYKALADETRLKCLLLICHQQELCVCELTAALALSQPKVSRHLALLKKSGLLVDRRQGQWIFYQINPQLDSWQQGIINDTLTHNQSLISTDLTRLCQMGERPERQLSCC